MKTLIGKELRENVKCVPLPGLLVLLVFLLDKPDQAMPDVVGAFFFALTAVGNALALGFVQFFFEAHGDERSLLLHRPLDRSRVFLAKALAGIGLYLVALGIPFLCLESWLATPGNIPAPFHWRTSFPWLADILSGLVYYFAGMLVAQRDVRWYGSRGLPLAAAFCCSYFVWIVPEFWQALVVIGIFASLLGVAAWGSFSTGGAYTAQPRFAQAALAVSFLAGLGILSMLGKQLVGFFFGWVGLLLMLALEEWPARIACPKCGKLRVVTRSRCEYCGALHTAPKPDGTEIFEPTAVSELHVATAN